MKTREDRGLTAITQSVVSVLSGYISSIVSNDYHDHYGNGLDVDISSHYGKW